jgi:hypothetical protein
MSWQQENQLTSDSKLLMILASTDIDVSESIGAHEHTLLPT